MGAKKIVIPIVVAAIVACGVGYYSYNIVKASTVSKNTTNSSVSSNVNTDNNSEQSNVASASNSNTNTNSNKEVSSINSNDSATPSTSKSVASSTSNSNTNNVKSTTKSENTTSESPQNTVSSSSTKATQSNSGTKTSSTSSSSNINPAVLNYIGIWSPSTEVLWDGALSKNIIPTQSQLNENKLTLTQSEYSFKDITIKNPVYKIVKVEECQIFGNETMGGYITVNNNSRQGLVNSPYDDLDFIVAVPQNATSNYIEEVTRGFNILNYPYIINGNLYAMLSSSENPIYEFSK